jgi:putative endonuclease
MSNGGSVYILTNKNRTVLYVGATFQLYTRIVQHKTKYNPKSFSARYNCDILVYYESFLTMDEAYSRERQIKDWSRIKKIKLIESLNPAWIDLTEEIAP